MIDFKDFYPNKLSAMGGFCGSLHKDALINIETVIDTAEFTVARIEYYRVWFWVIK